MPFIEIEDMVPVSKKEKVYEIVSKKYSLPDNIFVKDENGEMEMFCYNSYMRVYCSTRGGKTIDPIEYVKSLISKKDCQPDNEDENSL